MNTSMDEDGCLISIKSEPLDEESPVTDVLLEELHNVKIEVVSDVEFEIKPQLSIASDRNDGYPSLEPTAVLPNAEQSHQLPQINGKLEYRTIYPCLDWPADLFNSALPVKPASQGNISVSMRPSLDQTFFSCPVCHERFVQQSDVDVHIRKHGATVCYPCDVCSVGFTAKSSLNEHLMMHEREKTFVCSARYKQQADLSISHMAAHSDQKPYLCSQCPAAFADDRNLTAHMNVHADHCTLRCCPKCPVVSSDELSLSQHLMLHKGDCTRKCPKCPVIFRDDSSLNQHLLVHEVDCTLKCPNCRMAFTNVSSLEQHLVQSGNRTLKCPRCPVVFGDASSLRHLLVHNEDCALKGPECSVVSRDISSLRQHLLIHDGLCPDVGCSSLTTCVCKTSLFNHLRDHIRDNMFSKTATSCSSRNRNTSVVDEPATAVDKLDTEVDEPDTEVDKPDNGVDKPATAFDEPATGVDEPETGVDEPETGNDEPDTGVDEPDTGVEDSGNSSNNCVVKQLDHLDGSMLKQPNSRCRSERVCRPRRSTASHLPLSHSVATSPISIKRSISSKSTTVLSQDGEHTLHKQLFTCPICSVKPVTLHNLKRHMRMHNVHQLYNCLICRATFIRQSEFDEHMKAHANGGPYTCSICNVRFAAKKAVIKHMWSHVVDDNPFQCPVCSVRFKLAISLKVHMERHESKYPYSCPECPAIFAASAELLVHSFVHSRDRSFVCSKCSEEFYTLALLKRHMLWHNGALPYVCFLCSSAFKTKSSLVHHLVTGHVNDRCAAGSDDGESVPERRYAEGSGAAVCVSGGQGALAVSWRKPAISARSSDLDSNKRQHDVVLLTRSYKRKRISSCRVRLTRVSSEGYIAAAGEAVLSQTQLGLISTSSYAEPQQGSMLASNLAEPQQVYVSTSNHTEPQQGSMSMMNHTEPQQGYISASNHIAPQQGSMSMMNHTEPQQDYTSALNRSKFRKCGTSELYSCSHCPVKALSKPNLRVHMRIHNAVAPLRCPKCFAGFHRRCNLLVHSRVHRPSYINCSHDDV